MKKIILLLFLVLGVLSFAAPSYVDVNRIKKDGYDIEFKSLSLEDITKGEYIIQPFVSRDNYIKEVKRHRSIH